MNIGIDISQAVYEGTGVARFTEGLTRAILTHPGNHTWTFFYYHFRRDLPKNLIEDIRKSNFRIVSVPLPPKAMSFLWNDLHTLSIDTFIPRLDWFITSDWTEPPAKCKKATIVHDLAFKRFPETIDSVIMNVMQKKLDLVKTESSIIFADSEATKVDLTEFYQIPGKKIQVNYPGLTPPTPVSADLATLQKQYGFSKPFLITVGKLEPRKNLPRLFESFELLENPDVELLVVGQKGWGTIPKPLPGIKMLGFVPDDHLAVLYQNSLGLIFPSLWEGFGYPAVEAMSYGVPTALSGRSSLAELGKDTALLFDPMSTDSIKEAMYQLITDPLLRKELSQKGKQFAATLTWERYVSQLIQSLENSS